MLYRVNKTNRKHGSSMNTAKHNRYPALSPLATAVKIALLGVGLAAHSAGQAATIEVNSNTDNNIRCTLREAVTSVNDGVLSRGCDNIGAPFGTADTINIAASVAGDTITLVNGRLEIEPDTTVSINGNGVTIDGNQLLGTVYANSATLSINDIKINGGGINISDSVVTISDSTVSGNSAFRDDGIYISSDYDNEYGDSNLTVTNSTISGNAGSGIYANRGVFDYAGIDVTVIDSNISGNLGGGISSQYTGLTVTNSAISNNGLEGISASKQNVFINKSKISGNSQGGLNVVDVGLTIANSAISGNLTAGKGAGIYGINTFMSISNSTIFNNSAVENGGGIFSRSVSQSGDVILSNSTVSGNSALKGGGISLTDEVGIDIINSTISDNNGGGIYLYYYSTAKISNSIIANSRGDGNCSNPVIPFSRTSIVESDTASIIEDGSCKTSARAVDPVLLPLADNGCAVMHSTPTGPACVMTHALGTGSPAIDTAVDSDLFTDQIGTPRPQGAGADVGAFELSSIVATAPGFTVMAVNAVEGEDANVLFTITLDEPQAVSVGYDFSTEAGTATDGEDYVGRVGRMLFPVGVTVRERRVTVLDDGVPDEEDEMFSLVVTDINNSSATVTTQATIQENVNTVPQLSVAEVRAREGDGQAVVTVTLSEPSSKEVTVRFQTFNEPTQNNRASRSVDYVYRRGTIVFPPGATNRTRTITLIDDDFPEANEVFRFELSQPINAEIALGSERQRVFILNDD